LRCGLKLKNCTRVRTIKSDGWLVFSRKSALVGLLLLGECVGEAL
jgi:hypothetical protein